MPDLTQVPLLFAVAVLAAAAMGYSIQSGGTCMVAAVAQLVQDRSPKKLVSLAECSLWTAGLGLLVGWAGFAHAASPAYAVGWLTVLGGVLLGLGAWLNDACVFGSIARIGGRDWHYLLTPLGYYFGSALHFRLFGAFAAPAGVAKPHQLAPLLALALVVSLIVSLRALRGSRGKLPALWDYRHATIAIGFAFVPLVLIAGHWTYTEALGSASHGHGLPGVTELALFTALLGGAILGGRGSSGFARFSASRASLCLSGGALMGLGGALVPGGNDNLILVGLPGLQPHAWIAITAMVLAIILGLNAGNLLGRTRALLTGNAPGAA